MYVNNSSLSMYVNNDAVFTLVDTEVRCGARRSRDHSPKGS